MRKEHVFKHVSKFGTDLFGGRGCFIKCRNSILAQRRKPTIHFINSARSGINGVGKFVYIPVCFLGRNRELLEGAFTHLYGFGCGDSCIFQLLYIGYVVLYAVGPKIISNIDTIPGLGTDLFLNVNKVFGAFCG